MSAVYTGANAQAVESAVTTPLEQAINGVEGMLYMRSSSTNTGFCSITVTFEIGRNPDLAAVDVQNRVNQALGRMPQEVRTNGISVTKNSAGFHRRASGSTPTTTATTRCSSATTSTCTCATRSSACPAWATSSSSASASSRCGCGSIRTSWPGRGITPSDVVAALREQNIQVAAGSIGDAPAADDQMFQISVRAAGRLTTASEFEDIVVKAGRDGALVRVKDVGRVELGAENYSSLLRFGGKQASGVGIQLLPSANAIQVFAGDRAGTGPAARALPAGPQGRRSRSTT